jgi:hypothetical protein
LEEKKKATLEEPPLSLTICRQNARAASAVGSASYSISIIRVVEVVVVILVVVVLVLQVHNSHSFYLWYVWIQAHTEQAVGRRNAGLQTFKEERLLMLHKIHVTISILLQDQVRVNKLIVLLPKSSSSTTYKFMSSYLPYLQGSSY